MGTGGITGLGNAHQEPTTTNTVWLDFNDAPDPFDWEMVDLRAQRDEIKARLLAKLLPFLRWVFPNGVVKGRKFYVRNLRGDPGRSLEVELEGEKAGVFIDRATGDSGDVFYILAHHEGLDIHREFPKVLAAAVRWLGSDWLALHAEPAPRKSRRDGAKDDLGMHTAKWDYLSAEGKLIACVYRYDPLTGKTYRPRDVARGVAGVPEIRPLYNLPGLRDADQIVLVEGEKCAQALIDAGICATTAMQGAQARVEKTDWSHLQRKAVIVWPDKDKPGWGYAEAAGYAALAAGALSCLVLIPPEDKPEKWDVADAIAEGFDVQGFIATGERITLQPPCPRLPKSLPNKRSGDRKMLWPSTSQGDMQRTGAMSPCGASGWPGRASGGTQSTRSAPRTSFARSVARLHSGPKRSGSRPGSPRAGPRAEPNASPDPIGGTPRRSRSGTPIPGFLTRPEASWICGRVPGALTAARTG
jgi:putative DNA primase/helicase